MQTRARRVRYALPAMAVLAVVSVLVPGCPRPGTPNIVQTAQDIPELSTFVAAVEAADLTAVLAGVGPFTVFAPNNDAFDALPEGILDSLLEPDNQDWLIDILLGHVVLGDLQAADLQDGQTLTALNGNALSVTVENGVVRVDGIQVVEADVLASNGVIHIIDEVILPDVVQTAQARTDLSTLVTAVQAAELVDALQGEGPFTIFAPDNDAFAALPAGTLANLLLPANQDELVRVLQGHVVAGEFLAGDLEDGDVLTDLNGNPLPVTIANSTISVNDGARVIRANIVTANGVIHIIDKVILPPEQ